MSNVSNAALLQAYKEAIEADQYGIADLLEDVILELMGERTSPIVISESKTTTDPPWKVTCGPDTVMLGTTVTCTGIDHTTREVTS